MTTTLNGNVPTTNGSAKSNGHSGAPDAQLLAKVRQEYAAADQEHVFAFYDKLSPSQQATLLTQLASIDIHRVNRIYANAVAADGAPITPPTNFLRLDDNQDKLSLGGGLIGRSRTPSPTPTNPEEVLPLPQEACATILNNPADEARWYDIGLQEIADNKVGVLLLAGGQGTRLGSSLPKGMYDIGLPSSATLFDYQAGRIKKLQSVAETRFNKQPGSVRIRWYVMTSGPTRHETEKYFESQSYFGLDKNDVIFFEQGVLPALSNEGKLLLSAPDAVSVAPDGNGGIYAALRRPLSPSTNTTVLSDLKDRGIEYIHAYCVDNCLVKVADPVFIGCCITRHAAAGAKVVRKTQPTESVGVLAKKGDAYAVVEYSELSKTKAEMRNPDGSLAFKAANIANHFYTTKFLESVESMERKMHFHIARKKIPTIDLENGKAIKPDTPNGMKLELFIFDVFPFTRSLCVLEVERQEEFSPLKNAPGSAADCPETSRRDLLAQQTRWLVNAGAQVAEGVEVEVQPALTYGGEGLEWVKGRSITKSGVLAKKEDIKGLA